MKPGSSFIASLNAVDETPGAIDYTSIYSLHDELVQPARPPPPPRSLAATNILIQDVCAGRPVVHGAEPVDAAVYALALDALTARGPGRPGARPRRAPGLCTQIFIPGLTPDDGAIAQAVVYGNGLRSDRATSRTVERGAAAALRMRCRRPRSRPASPPASRSWRCLAQAPRAVAHGSAPARARPAAIGLMLTAAMPAPADGPALETPLADLDRALQCPIAFSGDHEPILFVHGTAGMAEDHWALDYQKILPDLGFDVCTVRLPNFALSDIQTATEYVVHAVRVIAAASGKPVDMVGYSQGGLEPRWAVKYWPDVQAAVDDIVTLATPHHGTVRRRRRLRERRVRSGGVADAAGRELHRRAQQRRRDAGRDRLHEHLQHPRRARAARRARPHRRGSTAGPTIEIQDVCPGRAVTHGAEPVDAAVFAVAMDALTHPGPADLARIDTVAVCAQTYLPGLTPDDGATAQEVVYGNGGETFALGPDVTEEPPLRARHAQ